MKEQNASRQKVKLYYSALAVGLAAIIIVHLLVPVYPAFTLPAIPDLFGIAVISGLLAMAWKLSQPIIYPKIQFFRYELVLLGLIWFNVIFLTAPRAILSIFKTPGQAWIPCNIIPGFSTKLECFLQASSTQHYGIRNYFILFIGTLLGTLVFLLAKTVRESWKFLLSSVVFGALLVVITGFVGSLFGIQQFLPKSLMSNPYGLHLMTQIFDNPGPVWTYLAPGLAISLWFTFLANNWTRRIFGFILSFSIILGIFRTTQRGGFLLCLGLLGVYGFYSIFKGSRKQNKLAFFLSITVLVMLGSVIYGLIRNPLLVYDATQSLGYSWKAAPIFIDEARFQIWQACLNLFRQSPLTGYGYASWYQIISEYARNHPVSVFHSAHNWFVQIPVEFGAIHGFLIFLITILIGAIAYKNLSNFPHGLLLLFLAIIAFFMPSLLGNIDDIRPVFYSNVILWSTLVGISDPHPKDLNNLKIISFDSISRRGIIITRLFWSLLVISSLAISFCWINFSWGGSAFEANLSQPSSAVFRWLGQSATIAAFKTAENKSYSISEIQPFEKPISVKLSNFEIEVNPEESLTLSLENGSQWLPKQHPVSFSKGMPDTARWISAGIYYPFLQSDFGIPWSKNMYWWEIVEGKLGRWCGQDCWFLAQSCGIRDRVNFSVSAPGRDRTPDNPLSFDLAVYNLPQGSQFSSQTLENLPSPLTQDQYQLTQPEEAQKLSIEGKPDTALYLVHVETQSTFTPASGDDRNLGVFIQEPDCQANVAGYE